MELRDGSIIAADAVVVAVGIRANTALARTAGLEVGRGIVVDDHLETNAAGVHAIGECAEHRGCCYGLVEPAYEQAQLLARRLAGERASYPGSVLATNLKVSGVNVFSAGDFLGTSADAEEIVLSDPAVGVYKKLVIAHDRLVGAVLFGDTADGLWYLELIRARLAGRALCATISCSGARSRPARRRERSAHERALARSRRRCAPPARIAAWAAACWRSPTATAARRSPAIPHHPANFGRLCSKGSALGETLGLDERAAASDAAAVDGSLARVDWAIALDRVADGFQRIIERDGPDAVAFYLSGQLLTEDYYVANKLMKGFIGSANVDTNSRLCMASSVAGHRRAFGADTVPGSYEDLDAGRPDRAGRLERRLVPSGAVPAHGHEQARARRQDRRDRSAPHRHRGGCRPVSSDRARAWTPRCSAGCWCISPTRARSTTRYIDAHTAGFENALARAREIAPDLAATARARPACRGRRRALLRAVPRHPARRHLLSRRA